MASKGKTSAKPAALNLALLASIVSATASAAGFMHVPPADAKALADAGYVEINEDPSFNDAQGNVAVRATQKGNEQVQSNQPASNTGAAPAATPAATKPAFTLVSGIAIPETQRKGVNRGESYPFGTMEVGQSFFIAATDKKPQPERSYASTVASARNRYATKSPSETRTTRKGNVKPVMTPTKDFAIRATTGDAYGQPGVKGAAIWRVA